MQRARHGWVHAVQEVETEHCAWPCQHAPTAHQVLELAHVEWPVPEQQRLGRVRRQRELVAGAARKDSRQVEDLFTALAERRNVDGKLREASVQVRMNPRRTAPDTFTSNVPTGNAPPKRASMKLPIANRATPPKALPSATRMNIATVTPTKR